MQNIAFIIGTIAIAIILVAIVLSLRGRGDVSKRLESYTGAAGDQAALSQDSKKRSTPVADTLNRAFANRRSAQDLSTQLARADLKVTVAEFIALQILSAVFFGVLATLGFQTIVLGLLGAVVGWFIPRWFVSNRQARRLHLFNDQLGDSLNLMVNGLRSGYSVMQAMDSVSKEMPAPIATEFARVVQEVQLGLTLEQTLSNMLRRIQSDDLDLMITAVNVQREVGGNLAEILDVISHTIRERVRIKGEIRTLTAQGRYSGYVVSLLPIGLTLVLFCINPKFVSRLFTSEGLAGFCGWAMVVCGLLMIGSGFFAIQKIVNIEV
jgi:tight adherence protein B